ncbi:MAG: outer membrane lipoprotein-sorting protein [Gemmatimonadetes bacterium]|nr:outer membrane lipoprotein-sorting protein [Gemmatimonadota bacterium]
MRRRAVARLLGVTAALVLAGTWTSVARAQGGNEILRRLDRNLTPESYESYRKLTNIEPGGRQREYLLFSVARGREKVAALFLSPAADRGRGTLRLGENMWLYIPNAGKPVRITSLQGIVGGIFNNADILALDYSAEYDVVSQEDAGTEYLLQLQAKTRTVAYDRLRMWVTKDRYLPTRIECLTAASLLIKTLYFKDIKDFGGGLVRPATIETDSPLHQGYKSIMVFVDIKKRTFPDEVFTLTFLPNVESLRR